MKSPLSWSTRQYCLCIFAVAIVVRFALLAILRPENHVVLNEAVRIAEAVALRGQYADPYGAMRTGPTAHYTPGYPLLVALEFILFGTGKLGFAVAYHINGILTAAQYALLPLLAAVLDVPPLWGFAGGMVGALIPFNFLSEATGPGESLVGVVFILIVILTLHTGKKGEWSFGRGLLHGLLWGVTLLVGPTALLLLIPVLLVLAVTYRGRLRALAGYTVALVLGAAVAISPWVIRNDRVLGAPIVFRSNLGLELAVAYNDTAAATQYADVNNQTAFHTHPYTNLDEARQVLDLGEVRYMHLKMEDAKSWVAGHPVRAAQLTLERSFLFFFPITPRPLQSLAIWGLTLLGIAGLPVLWRRSRFAAATIAAIWLMFPVLYSLLQFTARYRQQIQFAFLLPAGAAIVWGLNWLMTRWARNEGTV
jgi:hypothetical protein